MRSIKTGNHTGVLIALLLSACSSGSSVELPALPDNDGFSMQGNGVPGQNGDPNAPDASALAESDVAANTSPLDVAEWLPDTSSGPAQNYVSPSDVELPSDGFGAIDDPNCSDCGDPCEADEDCLSGWCVEGPDGDICTKTCEADCPPGMSCQGVNTGVAEITYICVPDHIYYCRPCSVDSDCTPNLLDSSAHRCLEDQSGAGSFCATACASTLDCPEGGVCKISDVGGESLQLCQPAEGECTCNAAAIAAGASTSCFISGGFGVCSGTRSCTSEGLSPCNALDAAVELCNWVDDDCDGETDEAFPLLGEPCDGDDVDTCVTGEWTCHDGSLICNEWNGPTPEICNGLDDDCDDKIDEGFELVGQACDGDDEDLCAEGTWVCLEGELACNDLSATTFETCNGEDDDCDSNTDEGFPEESLACDGEDPDACTDGTYVCMGGALVCQDDNDGLVELCNDLDDDCDGFVDEAFPTKGSPCDGADSDLCLDGLWACSNDTLACNDDLEAADELCNDFDDVCDDKIDEGWSNKGAPCDGDDDDECLDGSYVCNGTSLVCDDGPEVGQELCNNLDDDCDGQTDEGLVQTCSSQCGAGSESCSGGLWVGCTAPKALTCTDYDTCESTSLCSPNCPSAPQEVCDLLDNDCDGVTDEGHLGDASTLGDFADAWSDLLTFMGEYPEDTNGVVVGKLLPLGDIDWFTIEAKEDLSDFCITDGQDEPIKANLVFNAPGGSEDYEVCACWSSSTSFCAKSSLYCATSNGGSNAILNLSADMNCGSDDVVYLDVQVKPFISLLDYGCDNWTLSWSIDE